MKKYLVTLVVCLAVAAGLAASATVSGREQKSMNYKEVSLTGCLVQGSGPSVFILQNAKADPRDSSEKGRSYLLAGGSVYISFREHLNDEVRIDGSAEQKDSPAQSAGQSVREADMPKLKVTKVTHIATTCSSPTF